MISRERIKEHILQIISYYTELSPKEVCEHYNDAHTAVSKKLLKLLLTEMADDGTIQRVSKGVYRISA
jgi:predicted transcriptional regulator of viral defense system